MLQMGSSRNRDPLKLSRDEDPSWDLEEPPKPRRKPSRTYFMLFIIKIFINHHLAVTSLNLNWFQVLKCIFSGRRYDALRMVVQTQFFGWKFSQLGTYLFWTLHLCRYQCPPPGPREFVMHFNSRRQIIAVLVRLRHKIWVACKAKSAPLPKNWLEASTAHGTLFTSSPRSQHSGSSKSSHLRNASNVSALVVNILWKGDLWYVEFYTNMLYNYACLFSGNKCSAETHT